jgi:hypothetical protein
MLIRVGNNVIPLYSHRGISENLEIRLLMSECRLRHEFQANAKFEEILRVTAG